MFLSRKSQEKLIVSHLQGEVQPLIEWGCEEVGMAHVIPNITVEWSPAMRTTMGTAETNFRKEGGHIRLCIKLFARASEEKRKGTILHELAHILANLQAGRRVAHGWEWKRMMINLGQRPERCHKVDTTGIKRRQRRFSILCNSGCPLTLTSSKRTRMLNSMRRGMGNYRCTRCRSHISMAALTSASEVRTA